MVKNSPALQETQVCSLGWEDPLEEETATCFSIPARENPWREEPDRQQSTGLQKSWTWLSESVQFSSVTQSCPTLCDPMDCSTPGFPIHHQLPELTQTHIHRVGDAIQPAHPLPSPSPPAFNLSQHYGLFQQVNSSHQVAKVLGVSASASVLPMNIQDWKKILSCTEPSVKPWNLYVI